MAVKKKLALITGATSGIGAAFAEALAQQKYDLIITGRRVEKINAVADRLKKEHGVKVEVVISELTKVKDLKALVTKVKGLKKLDLLVNNAGFGVRGYFKDTPISTYEDMLKIHDLAPLQLMHAAVTNMAARKTGAVINVSSIAAFVPYVRNAFYAASKELINSLSKTLSLELKDSGVKVQSLCPGLTVTDFHSQMGLDSEAIYKKRFWQLPMRSEKVVEISLKYLKKDKVICIPGFVNKFIKTLFTLHRLFTG